MLKWKNQDDRKNYIFVRKNVLLYLYYVHGTSVLLNLHNTPGNQYYFLYFSEKESLGRLSNFLK